MHPQSAAAGFLEPLGVSEEYPFQRWQTLPRSTADGRVRESEREGDKKRKRERHEANEKALSLPPSHLTSHKYRNDAQGATGSDYLFTVYKYWSRGKSRCANEQQEILFSLTYMHNPQWQGISSLRTALWKKWLEQRAKWSQTNHAPHNKWNASMQISLPQGPHIKGTTQE